MRTESKRRLGIKHARAARPPPPPAAHARFFFGAAQIGPLPGHGQRPAPAGVLCKAVGAALGAAAGCARAAAARCAALRCAALRCAALLVLC
jgi:hypothetical protein